MADSDLRQDIRNLLASQCLCVVSTQGDGQPYASLMAFAESDDLARIHFATPCSTRKYENLMSDGRAALLVDNRTNGEADFHEAVAVTATGTVSPVTPPPGQRRVQRPLHPPSSIPGRVRSISQLRAPRNARGLLLHGVAVPACHGTGHREKGRLMSASGDQPSFIVELASVRERHAPEVGGRSLALARLGREAGLRVPDGVVVTAGAYRRHVEATGARERILLELSRKRFEDMRCEETWDAALRIRNLFIRTPLPVDLSGVLLQAFEERFGDRPVVVRSSAPGEDSSESSFAGLHESYVNVQGPREILDHVRLVWASLWSDRALLYRQKLKLDVASSFMAVLVQELVVGERSGVAFCVNPLNPTQAVVEAVHGLNQGLVDGVVEPDRWLLDCSSGDVVSHREPERDSCMVISARKQTLRRLPAERRRAPPLDPDEVRRVFELARAAEAHFGAPQDVEWTLREELLYLLQAHPITTAAKSEPGADSRSWYLGLHRSYENLLQMRDHIENHLLPVMRREADEMLAADPAKMHGRQLAKEILRRSQIHDKWVETYWKDFIPFVHGARLFGQVFNDVVKPSDPFAFLVLLGDDQMLSKQRNDEISQLARRAAGDEVLRRALEERDWLSVSADYLGIVTVLESPGN